MEHEDPQGIEKGFNTETKSAGSVRRKQAENKEQSRKTLLLLIIDAIDPCFTPFVPHAKTK